MLSGSWGYVHPFGIDTSWYSLNSFGAFLDLVSAETSHDYCMGILQGMNFHYLAAGLWDQVAQGAGMR